MSIAEMTTMTTLLIELTYLLTQAYVEKPEERNKGCQLPAMGERVIELLFTIFEGEMETFAQRLARDLYDYKDTVGNTWLALIETGKWRSYNSLHKTSAQHKTSARSWFRTVYKSLMIDYHRREVRRLNREYSLEQFAEENRYEDEF